LVQIKFITEDYNPEHKQILILIKTNLSIFNRKVYTTDWGEDAKHGLVGKIETDSILIKAKHKHLTKTSDRVSKMFCSASAKWKYS
jgi:hypothetical protein